MTHIDIPIENKSLEAYNLTVADFHTYFVKQAANDNAAPVWVHNACQAAVDIANGHAYDKHILNKNEFPGYEFRTRSQFADFIDSIISKPTQSGQLTGGRAYYYDAGSDAIVITNPKAPDGGTVFRIDPTKFPNPQDYINRLK